MSEWSARIRAAHSLEGVSSKRPVMPMTPFIGVRISWLMLARNSDFNLDDSRATSRIWASSYSMRFRSVTSASNASLAFVRVTVRSLTFVSNSSLVRLSSALSFFRLLCDSRLKIFIMLAIK